MAHRHSQRDFLVPSAEYRLYPTGLYQPIRVDMLSNAAATFPTVVTVTGDGVAHTKGAWSQIVASTSADCTLLDVLVTSDTFASATDTSTLLDIGVGAAASEVVVIPDIPIGYFQATAGVMLLYRFPVSIAAGSRVAARLQGAQTTKTASVGVRLNRLPNNLEPARYVTTYGTTAASSLGTTIAYPGSLNTKSAWVQLTASTTERLAAIVVGLQAGADTSVAAGNQFVDVGIGAAAAETVLVADIYSKTTTNSETLACPESMFVYAVDVPVGSRLSARAAYSANTNTVDVTVHGIPWRI